MDKDVLMLGEREILRLTDSDALLEGLTLEEKDKLTLRDSLTEGEKDGERE